jgi:cytosine/adenosine deaminase-related metal-dependent hydrolase
MNIDTPFFSALRNKVASLGGLFNAHLHLDRAGTLEETVRLIGSHRNNSEMSSLSLSAKHSLIPVMHDSDCYDQKNLSARVNAFLALMVSAGTTRADTLVDVTDDRVGLSALEVLLDLKASYAGTLDFRLGAYSPLGFNDAQPNRWKLLLEGVARADFIGSLPERDDQASYPDHIGFEAHCLRMIELAHTTGKSLHVHVDQKNMPFETGTEALIAALSKSGLKPIPSGQEPLIWLIHVISPSTYEESRFQALLSAMAEWNLGVICCPSAAISMRQIRPVLTPTGNSIARVLDMLAAGIPVRIGSDNICDITSPAGTADLVDEVFVLCNAMRFYDLDILAKVAAGKAMDADDIRCLRAHLASDAEEVARVVAEMQTYHSRQRI